MLTNRQLFLQHIAQTSDFPLMLEIERAEGIYMYDKNNKKYTDLISGIAVSSLGHRHPDVVDAVKKQIDKYMHLMVYGEYIQSPQTRLAALLTSLLPKTIDNIFFVNSGSEAVEGALKLAKRYTGRSEIISFKKCYHGSTHGALSLMSDNDYQRKFRPLLPYINRIDFNNIETLDAISNKTACVIIEPIQGEAGAVAADTEFMQKLQDKCKQTQTLLICDEIQTGFGRTGKMFAFEHYNIIPDIVLFAKGLGGGMPIGAFAASERIMSVLKNNPVLGHITTFGGHPVSCAAAYATVNTIVEQKLHTKAEQKAQLFRQLIVHPKIKKIHGKGLLMAIELESNKAVMNFIHSALQQGIVSDWFVFNDKCFRIAPPLIITDEEIEQACKKILNAL